MDELDVKIFRALTSEHSRPSFFTPLKTSLRDIARKLEVDDATLRNRYKRLRENGVLSGWKVFPNPNLFGYKLVNILIDMPPRTPKDDLMRKLRLVHGVVSMFDFHGDALGISLLVDSEQSLSRTIELISRITNAENIIQTPIALPAAQTRQLSDTDWAIICSLEEDASKSNVQVAKELGLTARTVKNRLLKLELSRALIIGPTLDVAAIDGMIGVILFYSYTNHEMKDMVDETILSHFDRSYLWATLSNPDRAYLILVAPTMASVKSYLEWTKQQAGIAFARVEIVVESIHSWNKAIEIFQQQRSFLLQSTSRRPN